MSHTDTILIIYNPISGRGRGKRFAETISNQLSQRDVTVELEPTSSSGDAQRMVRAAVSTSPDKYGCVVACGGDGTIQEVAHALATLSAPLGDKVPPLGLAPSGRCNDFARALGVPTDPSTIVEILHRKHTMPVDLGCANGQHFCTVATLGVDAQVSSFVDTMRMPLKGTLAYVYGAIRVLMKYRPTSIKLEGDFGLIDQSVFLATTANTSSYGGGIPIVPMATPTDGKLDVCVIDSVGRLSAFRMLPIVMTGRHAGRAGVRFLQTKVMKIHTDIPQDVWADGEHIATTPVTMSVVPNAIRVIVPA